MARDASTELYPAVNLVRFTRTATFRLALIYVAGFGIATALLFTFLYYRITDYSFELIRNSIRTEVKLMSSEEVGGHYDQLRREVNERAAAAESNSSYYLLQDADGRLLAGNIAPLPVQRGFFTLQVAPVRTHHAQMALMKGHVLANGWYLAVGETLDDFFMLHQEIGQALVVAGGAIALLAILGGLFLSAGFLRQLEAINRTVETIVRGHLDQRIPIRGARDEMDRLGVNLNRMLDRIQALMDHVRQVSNDVAHDLRTPLTRLRHRLERVQAQPATLADYERTVEACIAETDEILATSAALLRIAEVEAGKRVEAFRDFDLSRLFQTVGEIYLPVAEDAGQSLDLKIEDHIHTMGDAELITQMLVNLIENAVRHCPPGTALTLELAMGHGRPEGVVRDTGPGIPASERERVFQRFYRMERSRTTPGSGLGLALVAAIAELHDIVLTVEDLEPGTAFRLQFPSADATQFWRTQPAKAVRKLTHL